MFTSIKSFFGYSVEEERVPAIEKSELEGWDIINHENEKEKSLDLPMRRPESKTVARKTAQRIQDLIPELKNNKFKKSSKKSKNNLKTSARTISRSMRHQPIQQPRSKSFRN